MVRFPLVLYGLSGVYSFAGFHKSLDPAKNALPSVLVTERDFGIPRKAFTADPHQRTRRQRL